MYFKRLGSISVERMTRGGGVIKREAGYMGCPASLLINLTLSSVAAV